VDSSDICAAKDLKGSKFLCTPKKIQTVGSFAATLIPETKYLNNTVIPEREGTNDVGSEVEGEQLRG